MRSLRPGSVLAPCRSRVSVPLQLQKMLSMRWRIESIFQTAKDMLNLENHRARQLHTCLLYTSDAADE